MTQVDVRRGRQRRSTSASAEDSNDASAGLALTLLRRLRRPQAGAAAADLTAAQASQGPMLVEQIHNGFVIAPDFKFTQVDRKSSGLAGAYAGLVVDEHFFIGGGGYVLASPTRDRNMAYGGLVLQWIAGGNDVFGFSAKTLLGGGDADAAVPYDPLRGRHRSEGAALPVVSTVRSPPGLCPGAGGRTPRQRGRQARLTATSATVSAAGRPRQRPTCAHTGSTGADWRTINHISYQVADNKKTRDFYTDLLGMKVSQDDAAAGLPPR